MPRPRVTILEVMALVMFVALILWAIRLFPRTGDPRGRIRVRHLPRRAGRLHVRGAGGTGRARRSSGGWRFTDGCISSSPLRFGLGVDNNYTSMSHLTRRCLAALPMGGICGIASWYFGRSKPTETLDGRRFAIRVTPFPEPPR